MHNIFYKILQKFGPYNKFNILAFIPLGFCAGLPLPLIGATMSARLMDSGINFTSIVGRENIYGVQFHPEKSSSQGLNLLKKFIGV